MSRDRMPRGRDLLRRGPIPKEFNTPRQPKLLTKRPAPVRLRRPAVLRPFPILFTSRQAAKTRDGIRLILRRSIGQIARAVRDADQISQPPCYGGFATRPNLPAGRFRNLPSTDQVSFPRYGLIRGHLKCVVIARVSCGSFQVLTARGRASARSSQAGAFAMLSGRIGIAI